MVKADELRIIRDGVIEGKVFKLDKIFKEQKLDEKLRAAALEAKTFLTFGISHEAGIDEAAKGYFENLGYEVKINRDYFYDELVYITLCWNEECRSKRRNFLKIFQK